MHPEVRKVSSQISGAFTRVRLIDLLSGVTKAGHVAPDPCMDKLFTAGSRRLRSTVATNTKASFERPYLTPTPRQRLEFWERMSERKPGSGILPIQEALREETAASVHPVRVGVHGCAQYQSFM